MLTELAACAAKDTISAFTDPDAKQHDSRYVHIIGLIEKMIGTTMHNHDLPALLAELLDNTLHQTIAEDAHIRLLHYPGWQHHLQDHYKLCTATAQLFSKADRMLCTVHDLQKLREQFLCHIQRYDAVLENYLLAKQSMDS